MKDSPYSKFNRDQLILRDELAIDRTFLANERTLLAYLRSGVALLIAGVSIMHFSQVDWFWFVGLVCIPAGIITAIVGLVRYRSMKKCVAVMRGGAQPDTQKPAAP
jgi:putative membrane protein